VASVDSEIFVGR